MRLMSGTLCKVSRNCHILSNDYMYTIASYLNVFLRINKNHDEKIKNKKTKKKSRRHRMMSE